RYFPCRLSRAVDRSRTQPHRRADPRVGSTAQVRPAGRTKRGPAEAGPVALILDCALPALLDATFSRHRVFEEILVLRCEAFRKSENLKAVAIADGPDLDNV